MVFFILFFICFGGLYPYQFRFKSSSQEHIKQNRRAKEKQLQFIHAQNE